MVISFFKFFVEAIYHTTVAYNRAYNKSTKDELSDIKQRQFIVVWGILGFMIAFLGFCIGRYVIDRSMKNPSVFALEMAVDVCLSILIVKRLNKLGMYEEAIAKVENKDKRQLIRYRWRTALIGGVKTTAFIVVIQGSRWLLITFF